MAFTFVTLDAGGGYYWATGDVAPARLRATPLVPMTNGTTTIATEVVIPIATNGATTKTLAATTDPATTPAGNAYRIVIEAGGRMVQSFIAAIPHNAGSTVNVSDLVELEEPPDLIGPSVVLVDGATVALDSSLGKVFRLTAAGNRTIAAPTGSPFDGQGLIIEHTASGGARTLSLTTGSAGSFAFGTDITALTATSSGLTDYIGAIFDATANRWRVIAFTKGF